MKNLFLYETYPNLFDELELLPVLIEEVGGVLSCPDQYPHVVWVPKSEAIWTAVKDDQTMPKPR